MSGRADIFSHALRLENNLRVVRRMLFMQVVGHPEHHKTWSCAACESLKIDIQTELDKK